MDSKLYPGMIKHYPWLPAFPSVPKTMPETCQQVGIYTVEVGDSGAPPVLLLSGLAVLHSDWQDILAELGGEYHLLTYDRVGVGLSVSAPNMPPTSIYQEVELAREILTRHFDRPAMIVGHSMGGFIAESLVRLYPQLCAKLILLDSSCELGSSAIDSGQITQDKPPLPQKLEGVLKSLWQSSWGRRLTAGILYYSKPRPLSSLCAAEDKRLNLQVYSRLSVLEGILRELRGYSLWAAQRGEIARSYPLLTPTVVMAAQFWGICYLGRWGRLQRRWAQQLKHYNPQTQVKFCLFRSRHLAMRSHWQALIRVIKD